MVRHLRHILSMNYLVRAIEILCILNGFSQTHDGHLLLKGRWQGLFGQVLSLLLISSHVIILRHFERLLHFALFDRLQDSILHFEVYDLR